MNRYNIPREGTEDWHIPINENFGRLEGDVEFRDDEAKRDEYEPVSGGKFYAEDTGSIYIGDGSEWHHVESTGEEPSFQALQGRIANGNSIKRLAGDNLEIRDDALHATVEGHNAHNYTIYTDGETTYGYGPDGLVNSDTDSATVFNAVTNEIDVIIGRGYGHYHNHVRVAGDLEISHPISLAGATKYEFSGRQTLENGVDNHMFNVDGRYVWIDGLRASGRRGGNNSGSCIQFRLADIDDRFAWATISNCWIENFRSAGISESDWTAEVKVNNCQIALCDTGLYMAGSSEWSVSDILVTDCQSQGIYAHGGSNLFTGLRIFETRNGPGMSIGGNQQSVIGAFLMDNDHAGIAHWGLEHSILSGITTRLNGLDADSTSQRVGIEDQGNTEGCLFTNILGTNEGGGGWEPQKHVVWSSGGTASIYDNILGSDVADEAVGGDPSDEILIGNTID